MRFRINKHFYKNKIESDYLNRSIYRHNIIICYNNIIFTFKTQTFRKRYGNIFIQSKSFIRIILTEMSIVHSEHIILLYLYLKRRRDGALGAIPYIM